MPPAQPEVEFSASSFTKGLFRGEIHEDLILPFPQLSEAERDKSETLIRSLHDFAADSYDERAIEKQAWIPDELLRGLGERGLLGLYIPEEYGGQGLSQTAYCRVSEEFGRIDGTLAVVMGVHQSIGSKGLHLYGSKEQKDRFLPDLASGKKLAAFALTEPNAGSDAYHIETRAEKQSDGSYKLNGEKRYIGNGSRADVLTVFARSDEGHIALLVEADMEGFEPGERYDTMGLRANDLRRLRFKDVRVPPENVLGAPGEGFQIAMRILDSGRMSLGTGSAGAVKKMLTMILERVQEREQFGRPLASFELVQDKIAWTLQHLYGLESMSYLTTGMQDRGVEDVALESAMVKVIGTEFLWYAVNRIFQLGGGEAYMRDNPYEKILRDVRIFPIFEGTNDVLRSYVALSGITPLMREVRGLEKLDPREPLQSLGTLASYVSDRVQRAASPEQFNGAHSELHAEADRFSDQTRELRNQGEALLRRHGRELKERQLQQKRIAHAAMDLFAQAATLSRLTRALDGASGGKTDLKSELDVGRTFLRRAAGRVDQVFHKLEHNDDENFLAAADTALQTGGYCFEPLL